MGRWGGGEVSRLWTWTPPTDRRATSAIQRTCHVVEYNSYYTGMFPVGDTSSGTLIAVCVCVSLSADISLYCAKNDSTDYPEILWVCWV